MEPLKGQATSFGDIAKKPEYINAAPEVQADVAYRYFEDNFASKPAYKRAAPEVQADARARFMADYNVPEIEMDDAQRVEAPEFESPQGFSPLRELNKGLTTVNLAAGAFADPFSDAMTLGYGDSKELTEEMARKQFPDIETDQGLLGMAYRAHQNPIANTLGEFAGMINPVTGVEGVIKGGLQAAGRKLLPKTTRMAQAAGVGTNVDRMMLDFASRLQGGSILAQMGRLGAAGSLYGGIKSHPGHQLNIGQRAQSAATEGAMWSVGAPLAAGAGQMLKGGVTAFRDFVKPSEAQIGFAKQARVAVQRAIYQELQKLSALLGKLHSGEIDPALVDPEDYAALVTKIDELSQALLKGKPPQGFKKSDTIARKIEIKAQNRAKKAGRDVKKAETEQQNRPEQQPAQGQRSNEQATKPGQDENQAVESPFEVPTTQQSTPNIVGYVNKELGAAMGAGEAEVTLGKNDAKHIAHLHKEDIKALGLNDAKEYVAYVLKHADEVLKNLEDGSFLVVSHPKGGHVAVLRIYKDTKTQRYMAKTAFKPSFRKGEESKGGTALQAYLKSKKTKPLWSRAPVERPVSSSSLTDTALNAQSETGVANGQSGNSHVSTPNNAPQPPKQLTGSVKEMVDSALESFGGTIEDAKALIVKVKVLGKAEDDEVIKPLQEQLKLLPKGKEAKAERDALKAKIDERKAERKVLRDKAGTIHGNLREVLNTGWDGASPLATQNPVDEAQLTREAIEDLVDDKKVLDQIDNALQAGASVRGEFTSEITGSTDAAAKVTAKGSVKVPLSTFTPTHYVKVGKVVDKKSGSVLTRTNSKGEIVPAKPADKAAKDAIEAGTHEIREYPAVSGYNEQGHTRLHYFDSPEGGAIANVKVLGNEQFVGTTPNVVLGPRPYKVSDVLKRKPDIQEGILTSEALSNAKAFAGLFTPETIKQFSKPTQNVIKSVQKRGRFDEHSINEILKRIENNKEDLAKVCNIFGLK